MLQAPFWALKIQQRIKQRHRPWWNLHYRKEGRQDIIQSQMVIDRMETNEAEEGRGSLREEKECNLDRMAEATLEQRGGGPEPDAPWRAGGAASR